MFIDVIQNFILCFRKIEPIHWKKNLIYTSTNKNEEFHESFNVYTENLLKILIDQTESSVLVNHCYEGNEKYRIYLTLMRNMKRKMVISI